MRKKIFSALKIVFFIALGVFFIFWFLAKLTSEEKQEILNSFKSVNYLWVVVAFVINIISHVLRTLRWQLLFKPMGYKPKFGITFSAVMTGYLANLAVPRLGEVVRCGILDRYAKIPLQKSLGSVISERIVDVFVLGLIILLGFLVEFQVLKDYVYDNIAGKSTAGMWTLVLAAFGVLALFILLFFALRKRLEKLALYLKITNIVLGFWEGIISIFKLSSPLLFILYSIGIWVLYFLGTYVIFFCLPETSGIGMKAALVALVLGAIGNMITPGGIGLFPLLFSKALSIYGVASPIGYALGWISWVTQQIGAVIIGLFSLIGLSLKKYGKTDIH